MSEEKLVPKLRFGGFDDEWKNSIGKKTFRLLGGGSFKSKDSVNEGVLWLKIANVGINQIKNNDLSYLPRDFLKTSNKYLLKKGDVILALTRPILDHKLKIAIINDEFNNSLLNQRVGKITSLNNVNIKFIYYYLQLPYSIYYLESKISGSDPPNLSNNDLLNIPINIPSYNEQQKISQFLSLIDKKMELLEQKQQKYCDFKKYLMQQIFARKLRFDFTDEWNYLSVNDIFKSISPKKYQIKSAEINDNGDFEVIDQGQDEIAGYFNDKTKLCHDLPIIIYGDHTTFVKFRDKPFIVGADGVKLLSPKINAIPKYLFYALEHFNIKPEGYKRHFSIIKKVKLPIPNLEEQNEISNIFSNVDIKIKCTQKQLNETKEFKKGLLQQMFV